MAPSVSTGVLFKYSQKIQKSSVIWVSFFNFFTKNEILVIKDDITLA
jgi:hypothetical protein